LVEVHLIFPAGTSLVEAHRQATAIERVIEGAIEPRASVTTHLECITDHDDLHQHSRRRFSEGRVPRGPDR
ncbi:MAG TPA: cation transporter dimerization domain-containing protein, partial [Verrucomicrobiota bacterium]|nr:cation transporter dimerization domain-containing protein [Verrucomicrobiota bacterium]